MAETDARGTVGALALLGAQLPDAVVPARDESVYGVVWRLSSSALEDLDEIEDPDAYVRRVGTVHGIGLYLVARLTVR